MSIEQFHENIESMNESSPIFKALQQLREREDIADSLVTVLKWPNWSE